MTDIATSPRLGTLAILVADREQAGAVNALISQHERLILGRIGLPYREKRVSIIVLLVQGTTDELGAFSGKLGTLPEVKIRSAVFNE
jgi:putative iron-only hydrogenase system regulator